MYEVIPGLTSISNITNSCFLAEKAEGNGKKEGILWGEEHNCRKGEVSRYQQDIKPLICAHKCDQNSHASSQQKWHAL